MNTFATQIISSDGVFYFGRLRALVIPAVDGENPDVRMGVCQTLVIGKLLDAGGAEGGPQVEDDHLPAGIREAEFAAAQQVGGKVGQHAADAGAGRQRVRAGRRRSGQG